MIMREKPRARPVCVFCHRRVFAIVSIRVAQIGICHECARTILDAPALISAVGRCWFCSIIEQGENGRWCGKTVPLANLQRQSGWGICFSCAWKAYKALYARIVADIPVAPDLALLYAAEREKIKAGVKPLPDSVEEAMSNDRKRSARKQQEGQPKDLIPSNYREIPVGRIRGNKWNPRSSGFDGPKFDELVASIRQRGVIQPIVVRSIQEESHDYEILAGERRHRAVSLIAAEDPARCTIPAILRECDDEEAFEICFIENLQRQDLTEPEEAHAFAEYVDRKGPEGVIVLAERLGVSPRYVRKRVEIMRLPKPLIWAWQKELIQYGHLEQFLRISGKKERLLMLKQIVEAWSTGEGIPTVRDFKQMIDEASAELSRALFEKSECARCARNSETQRNLFGIEDDHARCLDSQCYIAKQKEWLRENWRSHLQSLDPELKVNGIRFNDEASHQDYEALYYGRTNDRCLECENLVAILYVNGAVFRRRACFGRKECRQEVLYGGNARNGFTHASPAGENAGQHDTGNENGTPAKAWHGEYFRELFFKTRIPEKAKDLDPFHEKMIQLTLFAVLASNSHIHRWFAERMDLPNKPKESDYGFFLLCRDIFPIVESLDPVQAVNLLQEAAIEVLMSNRTVMPQTRRAAAAFLGIDLAAEWRITREYLEKKTKGEIVGIIERFSILDRPEAWKFASDNFGMKRKSGVGKLKKEQMMRIVLESGIDLAGIVPAEILYDSTPVSAEPAPNPVEGPAEGDPEESGQIESSSALDETPLFDDLQYESLEEEPGYTVDPEEMQDAV